MDILTLFCSIDDFCRFFEPMWRKHLIKSQCARRHRPSSLALSEVMTIIVLFHQSGYRNFKTFYTEHVCKHLASDFPHLVSYNRFVELMTEAAMPLAAYLQSRYGECSGISFIDSTDLAVCHNRRIAQHRVFRGLAARGKTSVDWFYGFKLHLVINECGELLGVRLTPGNVDDRVPVPELAQKLWGQLFGDRGYISGKLFEMLFGHGLQLVTKIKRNMRNRLMTLWDKAMLRKRAVIESVVDQLKNISQIEHTRHRSPINFVVNVLAGLVAYTWQEKKPSLNIVVKELGLLPSVAS
jgi:hypothetical protein